MTEKPWYHQGLRFECTGCGDCCTGAPGYVWVNKEEIQGLAEQVGEENLERFEKMYVRQVGIRKSLKEYSNGDCFFFDNQTRKCKVYNARPRQCRTWPFWDSNVRDEQAWRETCQACPGSGKGKLYQLAEIEQQRRVMRV